MLYVNVCINVHGAGTTPQTAAARPGGLELARNYRNPSKIKVALRGSRTERRLDLILRQRETKQNETDMAPALGGSETARCTQ